MVKKIVNGKEIKIQHFLSDGREIEDLSEYTLPKDNPAYKFIASLTARKEATP